MKYRDRLDGILGYIETFSKTNRGFDAIRCAILHYNRLETGTYNDKIQFEDTIEYQYIISINRGSYSNLVDYIMKLDRFYKELEKNGE